MQTIRCPECSGVDLSFRAQQSMDLCEGPQDVDFLINGEVRQSIRNFCGAKLADLIMNGKLQPSTLQISPSVQPETDTIIDLTEVKSREVIIIGD